MISPRLLDTATVFGYSIIISSMSLAQPIEPRWDTIYTGQPGTQFVALAVSNFGEVGQAGAGGVNMDFTACGLECGTRHEDSVYLYSASPFLLEADASHANITLTCSYGQAATLKHYAWQPVEFDTTPAWRRFGCAIQNVVPHGRFISPDGHFAWEYFHVDPYEGPGYPAVTFLNRVYALDGQNHPNVTLGWVEDWSIPSDLADSNFCWADSYYREWYLNGTDSTNDQPCLSGSRRSASSTVMWTFTGNLFTQEGMCGGNIWQERTVIGPASLIKDVSALEESEPPSPDAVAWWNLIGAHEGLSVADSTGDLAVWNTAVHHYYFSAADTLYFWTVLATAYNDPPGGVLSVKRYGQSLIFNAIDCYADCAYGRAGDADGEGYFPDEITLGDVMLMVDVCFISSDCSKFICVGEADVDQSGYPYTFPRTCLDWVTLGDIMILVDFLFISGPSMALPCTY